MHLTQKDKAVAERTDPTSSGFSRRTFIANASALSAASLLGVSRPLAAEPPPEVKKIRLVHTTAICLSPQYIAEELLRLEGFSTIEYVDTPVAKGLTLVEAGRADMTMGAAPDVVRPRLFGKLAEQLDAAAREGILRPISPQAFVLNLVSMVVYPFAARPFVMAVMGLDDARFTAMMQQRKTELPEFFLAALRP